MRRGGLAEMNSEAGGRHVPEKKNGGLCSISSCLARDIMKTDRRYRRSKNVRTQIFSRREATISVEKPERAKETLFSYT